MRFLVMLLLFLVVPLGAADPDPEEPLTWQKPKKVPPCAGTVADDVYATWVAKVDATAECTEPYAQLIAAVDRAAPGAAAGLRPGDLLTHCDGIAMTDVSVLTDRKSKARTIRWIASDGSAKTAEVPAGLLGIESVTRWLPSVALRSVNAKAKGIEQLRVAAKALYPAPEIAEAALARAVTAGYKMDGTGYLLASYAKLRQGKVWEARDLAWYACAAPKPDPEAKNILALTAMATFQWHIALPLLEKPNLMLPSWRPEAVQAAIDEVRKAKAQPLPSRVIGEKPYFDVLREAVVAHPGEKGVEHWVGVMRERGWGKLLSQQPNMASIFVAGPPLADADLRARFSVRPLGDNPVRVERRVVFGFVDADSINFPRFGRDVSVPGDYDVELREQSGIDVWPTLDHQYLRVVLPIALRFDGKTMHDLRIAVLGDRYEVFLNGHRVALGWRPPGHRRKLHPFARIYTVAEANLVHMEVCDPARPDPERTSHRPPRDQEAAKTAEGAGKKDGATDF